MAAATTAYPYSSSAAHVRYPLMLPKLLRGRQPRQRTTEERSAGSILPRVNRSLSYGRRERTL